MKLRSLTTDKNQLKLGVIISYLSMGIGFIIYFFITPIILKKIGREQYGIYSLVLSVANYLNLLSLGLNSSYIRFYIKFKEEKKIEKIRRLNGTFITIFLLLGIVSALICFSLSLKPEIILENSSDLNQIIQAKKMLKVLSVMTVFSFLGIVFNCCLTAHEKFIYRNLLQFFKIIIYPILIFQILERGYGPLGLIIVTSFLSIIVVMFSIVYCLKILKISFSFRFLEKKNIKEMFSFSSFIFLGMVMDQILWNIDKIILAKTSGMDEVAIYSIASEINQYYITIGVIISGVFISKVNKIVFSIKYTEVQKNIFLTELMSKIGRIQFLILSTILCSIILFGKKFIELWVGIEYLKSYNVVLILLLPLIIPLSQSVGIEIERAKNKQKFMCFVGFLLALLNLLLSIPLAKLYGSIGSAVGTGLSLIIGFVFIRNYYYNSIIGLNIRYILFEIFKIVPVFCMGLLVGYLLLQIFEVENFVELFLVVFVFNILYISMIWLWGLNKFEKELILSPIKKAKGE